MLRRSIERVRRLFLISLRNALRQGRRSIVALSAIGFGVIALLIAGGFIGWILSEMRELSIRTWYGHVQVAKVDYWERGAADPAGFLVDDEPQAIARLRADDRVATLAPRLRFAGLVSHDETTLSFIGEGVDPEAEARFGRSLIFLPRRGRNLEATDAATEDGQESGAVIGQGLAANLGVETGDLIVLLANTPSGGVNAVELRIRGVFLTANKAFDDSTLRLPLLVAQRLLRVEGVHSWTVLLKRSGDTDAVGASLRRSITAGGLEVRPWTALAENYLRTEALFGRQLGAMALVLGLLIVLGISNTMTTSVMERTAEIGTAMALGASSRSVLAQFMMEGALLGAFGGLAGAIVGLLLAVFLSWIGIPLPPPPGLDTPIVAAIRVDPALVIQAVLIAAGSTVLASIYPALRASRLVIVDALRHARV